MSETSDAVQCGSAHASFPVDCTSHDGDVAPASTIEVHSTRDHLANTRKPVDIVGVVDTPASAILRTVDSIKHGLPHRRFENDTTTQDSGRCIGKRSTGTVQVRSSSSDAAKGVGETRFESRHSRADEIWIMAVAEVDEPLEIAVAGKLGTTEGLLRFLGTWYNRADIVLAASIEEDLRMEPVPLVSDAVESLSRRVPARL